MIKKFFTSIWAFIKNPGNRNIVYLIGIIALIALLFRQCNATKDAKDNEKRKEKIYEQNVRAMSDTINYQRNKVGELEATKSSFVTDIKDLKKMNADLYREVKKEIGEVRGLIKGSMNINTEPIVMSNELIKHDLTTYGLQFTNTKIDSGFTWKIKGESLFKLENNTIFPGVTRISENTMNIKLVMGFKENKDNYEVFARSPSSNIVFDDLSGVLIIAKNNDITCPPVKKKRWGIGVNAGFGAGYDIIHNNFAAGPMLSIGVQYNFAQW